MKLEDIVVGGRYVFNNHGADDDPHSGSIVTVQSTELDWLFQMLPCINEAGEEGLADPDELSPIPKEN